MCTWVALGGNWVGHDLSPPQLGLWGDAGLCLPTVPPHPENSPHDETRTSGSHGGWCAQHLASINSPINSFTPHSTPFGWYCYHPVLHTSKLRPRLLSH